MRCAIALAVIIGLSCGPGQPDLSQYCNYAQHGAVITPWDGLAFLSSLTCSAPIPSGYSKATLALLAASEYWPEPCRPVELNSFRIDIAAPLPIDLELKVTGVWTGTMTVLSVESSGIGDVVERYRWDGAIPLTSKTENEEISLTCLNCQSFPIGTVQVSLTGPTVFRVYGESGQITTTEDYPALQCQVRFTRP